MEKSKSISLEDLPGDELDKMLEYAIENAFLGSARILHQYGARFESIDGLAGVILRRANQDKSMPLLYLIKELAGTELLRVQEKDTDRYVGTVTIACRNFYGDMKVLEWLHAEGFRDDMSQGLYDLCNNHHAQEADVLRAMELYPIPPADEGRNLLNIVDGCTSALWKKNHREALLKILALGWDVTGKLLKSSAMKGDVEGLDYLLSLKNDGCAAKKVWLEVYSGKENYWKSQPKSWVKGVLVLLKHGLGMDALDQSKDAHSRVLAAYRRTEKKALEGVVQQRRKEPGGLPSSPITPRGRI